jgi:putative ABC transport system substrate-binding protein
MRRRDFITLLGGAAAAWPVTAQAQQRAMPVVGYLLAGTPEANVSRLAAFRRGLSEVAYVEGLNLEIEYRWGQNQPDRLAELAADLVRRRVSVIATVPSTQAALVAKAATTTVPIVFAVGSDPIALGLVASLNRPGGNATGISFQTVELVAKRLGLLRELAPAAARFVALVNPNTAFADTVVRDLQTSAQSLGLPVEVLRAGTVREIDTAFGDLVQRPGSALLISPDEFLVSRRAQIVTLSARHALPTIYPVREFSDIGGLMSYGPNIDNACQ